MKQWPEHYLNHPAVVAHREWYRGLGPSDSITPDELRDEHDMLVPYLYQLCPKETYVVLDVEGGDPSPEPEEDQDWRYVGLNIQHPGPAASDYFNGNDAYYNVSMIQHVSGVTGLRYNFADSASSGIEFFVIPKRLRPNKEVSE